MIEYRVLTPDDAAAYWHLRLEALEREPGAYYESAEEHRATTVADAAARLGASDEALVVGGFADGRLRAMAGLARERARKARHKGVVWGVYVGQELRGAGVGRGLLEALLARARAIEGLERLALSVGTTRAAPRALYRAVGFATWGVEAAAIRLADGTYVDEEWMALAL